MYKEEKKKMQEVETLKNGLFSTKAELRSTKEHFRNVHGMRDVERPEFELVL